MLSLLLLPLTLSLSLSLAGERTTRDAKSMRLCASERARKFNVWLGFFCRIFFFCRGAASNTYTRTHAHLWHCTHTHTHARRVTAVSSSISISITLFRLCCQGEKFGVHFNYKCWLTPQHTIHVHMYNLREQIF